MALFTDGQVNTLQALRRYESGLLDLAGLEQIDITAKTALAQDLIGSELLLFLLRHGGKGDWRNAPWGQTPAARRQLGVSDVVWTEPLLRWSAVKSIELVYRDAYNNQLNDRYLGKWNQYKDLANEAAEALWRTGVGLVADPLPKAVEPLLVAIAGSTGAQSYYVRMAWLNQAGQEGSASNVVGLQTVRWNTVSSKSGNGAY